MRSPQITKQAGHGRKLHRGHFAFMRALAQGLDPRASWDRYLHLEGEGTDLRTVRRTVTWIRDAFAAAAKREQKPGTARLILLDADRFGAQLATMPSLEAFAADRGLEEFSEAEQLEAYLEAYPAAGGGTRTSRRARVIERQLLALQWLEALVAQDPRPGDSVAAWLNPVLATRLENAGVPTLFALVERVNGVGARWWARIPGIGARKGARILEWLQENQATLGMAVGVHASVPRSELSNTALDQVVPAASDALVPFEKLRPPSALDGSAGRFRAPVAHCLLMAENDHEAIGAWIAAKRGGQGGEGLSATQRSYRKEAERLLLWCVLERRKALSSLAVEDATEFGRFLQSPPAAWCGPRHHQRWSPLWRPLEGPLSAAAMRQALTILRGLYAFLVSQGYVVGNPFAAVSLPALARRPLGSNRSLTFAQWDHLDTRLDTLEDTAVNRRLRRGMRWLYATGLRLSEITAARCGDLEPLEYRDAKGKPAMGWLLNVVGKGQRSRQVPVPAQLLAEVEDELKRQGRAPMVSAQENQDVAILSRYDETTREPLAWSGSGLYKAIKRFADQAAAQLEDPDAGRMRRASTHWLRHSHGSHALQGREGHPAVPLQVVQNNLGHASVATTSLYLTTEQAERLAAMEGFWTGAD